MQARNIITFTHLSSLFPEKHSHIAIIKQEPKGYNHTLSITIAGSVDGRAFFKEESDPLEQRYCLALYENGDRYDTWLYANARLTDDEIDKILAEAFDISLASEQTLKGLLDEFFEKSTVLRLKNFTIKKKKSKKKKKEITKFIFIH